MSHWMNPTPAGSLGGRSGLRNAGLAGLITALAALPLLNRVEALELCAALGVACLSCWSAWRSTRLGRELGQGDLGPGVSPNVPASACAPSAQLPGLLEAVLPVWIKHVRSVKVQTEQATTELAMNFAAINGQFEAAGFKGASGVSDSASIAPQGRSEMSLLTLCERELKPLLGAMSRMMKGKDALMLTVRDLVDVTSELQSMVGEVGSIAMQTNLLAINAAIEAAHAGPSGRGFAIIANEVRQLSQASAKTGKSITDRMMQASELIKAALAAANEAVREDQLTFEGSTQLVQDVLGHVHELGVQSEGMREHGTRICESIEKMLVDLQFQDRVSQIISVVDSDISRLNEVLEGGQPMPDPQSWLSEMKQHYTMGEQHDLHAASLSDTAGLSTPQAASKTVFF